MKWCGNACVFDYDFFNERHWLPGDGKAAFKVPDSITRARELTCADLAHNADEIFATGEIAVFGTPRPGLASWK